MERPLQRVTFGHRLKGTQCSRQGTQPCQGGGVAGKGKGREEVEEVNKETQSTQSLLKFLINFPRDIL